MRIKEKINKKKRNKPRRTFKSYEAYKLSTLMVKCSQMALKCEMEAFYCINKQPHLSSQTSGVYKIIF